MGFMHAFKTDIRPVFFVLTLLLSSVFAWAQTTPSAVVTTPQVRAELMAYAPQGMQAGQALWVGLQIKHQPGWHT
jgi:thiol:disulfide interchange protein DsbD